MKLLEKKGYFNTAVIAPSSNIGKMERSSQMANMSKEEKLIRALKKGDTKALEKFIGKYNRYVSSVISRIIGGREADCEELTADVFLAAWNNRENLQAEKITSYLGKIARNKAFDLLRQDKDALPLEDDILIFDKENIEAAAEQRDLSEMLKEALGQLDVKQRELFVRHYYYGQTIKDAAEEMGVNLSTAKTWIYRGHAVLKDFLEKKGFDYV